MAKWIDLLKPGTWKDRTGKVVSITKETLERILGNYKTENPAHILVGHPDKPKVPSFGVIDRLRMAGDTLQFMPGKVVEEFAALVGKGCFPGVSAGLTADCSKLDHVALLSAEKPAVDGLRPILEFSAAPEVGTVSVDISEVFDTVGFSAQSDWLRWRIRDVGRMLRNLKNYLIEKDGQERADQIMAEYELDGLQQDPPAEQSSQFSHSPQQGGTMDFEKMFNELTAAVNAVLAKFQKPDLAQFSSFVEQVAGDGEALRTENGTLKARVAELETAQRKTEFSAFAEKLIAERKLLPDQKDATIEKLEAMHAATPVNFSAADGKKSPIDMYKEELESRPVVAPKTGAEKGPEFSAGSDDGIEIGKRMSAYMSEMKSKGTPVTVIEARKHVIGK